MIFTRLARKNGAASTLALALALATGGAVGLAAIEAPAVAQKKPKYSKAFIAAYSPLETALGAETQSRQPSPQSSVPSKTRRIAMLPAARS